VERGEINIRPWGTMLWGLREANKRIRWKDRKPYAFWKGNPSTSGRRADLMKCNVSDKQDWNARVYAQVKFLLHQHGTEPDPLNRRVLFKKIEKKRQTCHTIF
jgi:hypothetical protein